MDTLNLNDNQKDLIANMIGYTMAVQNPISASSFNKKFDAMLTEFIDSGSEECDAINYVINNVEVISSN